MLLFHFPFGVVVGAFGLDMQLCVVADFGDCKSELVMAFEVHADAMDNEMWSLHDGALAMQIIDRWFFILFPISPLL